MRWPLGPDGLLAQEQRVGGVGDRRTRTSRARSHSATRCCWPRAAAPACPAGSTRAPYGETRSRRWAVGGEDLAFAGGEVVSLSEHPDFPRPLPRRRTVFRTRALGARGSSERRRV